MVAVDVERRAHELEVGDQPAADQRRPLDVRAEPLDLHDGGVGPGVLDEDDVAQIEGEADRVEVEAPDGRRVAVEPLVHLALHLTPQRLVEEEGGDDQEDRDGDGDAREPSIPARCPAEPLSR